MLFLNLNYLKLFKIFFFLYGPVVRFSVQHHSLGSVNCCYRPSFLGLNSPKSDEKTFTHSRYLIIEESLYGEELVGLLLHQTQVGHNIGVTDGVLHVTLHFRDNAAHSCENQTRLFPTLYYISAYSLATSLGTHAGSSLSHCCICVMISTGHARPVLTASSTLLKTAARFSKSSVCNSASFCRASMSLSEA